MSLKWRWFRFKQRFMKNFATQDLRVGVKIEWFKGVSTITEVSTALMFDVEDAECKPIEVTYYILDTNYYFKDEPDGIMEEDILRVIKER